MRAPFNMNFCSVAVRPVAWPCWAPEAVVIGAA
jgi:hypothetical protein